MQRVSCLPATLSSSLTPFPASQPLLHSSRARGEADSCLESADQKGAAEGTESFSSTKKTKPLLGTLQCRGEGEDLLARNRPGSSAEMVAITSGPSRTLPQGQMRGPEGCQFAVPFTPPPATNLLPIKAPQAAPLLPLPQNPEVQDFRFHFQGRQVPPRERGQGCLLGWAGLRTAKLVFPRQHQVARWVVLPLAVGHHACCSTHSSLATSWNGKGRGRH